MIHRLTFCVVLLSLVVALPTGGYALDPEPGAAFVRVVDVGAGLCCVVKIPGPNRDHYVIYDAGNWQDSGASAFKAIMELIPLGKTIDLLVLSHTDSDHIAATPLICAGYKVNEVMRGGVKRPSRTWRRANTAIAREVDDDDCDDFNLTEYEFPLGNTYDYGHGEITFVYGSDLPPASWNLHGGEKMNAGSIVIRFEYKGKSILFCGDTVGRHKGQPADACIAAENWMADNSGAVSIDSDVIIAPHHGGDNGGSTKFIQKVTPEYVVFSAGHKYQHPTKAAAQRYLKNGVSQNKIFRTDRGDNEGGFEWTAANPTVDPDPVGDDDVDILILKTGELKVEYRDN